MAKSLPAALSAYSSVQTPDGAWFHFPDAEKAHRFAGEHGVAVLPFNPDALSPVMRAALEKAIGLSIIAAEVS